MLRKRLRENDAVYYDLLSLKKTGASSIKVAASMTTAIIRNLIRQLKEEYPDASKAEILQKVRKLMVL